MKSIPLLLAILRMVLAPIVAALDAGPRDPHEPRLTREGARLTICGMKKAGPAKGGKSAAGLIDARIKEYPDWRGETLARLRSLVKEGAPGVVEEWKWDVPVWSSNGIICTGEVYKKVVKMTFPKGASVPDPSRLFNSSLEGRARRAIDFAEGEKINEKALIALVRAAAKLNESMG